MLREQSTSYFANISVSCGYNDISIQISFSQHNVHDFLIWPTVQGITTGDNRLGTNSCVASNNTCIWWSHHNTIPVCPIIDFLLKSIIFMNVFGLFALNISVCADIEHQGYHYPAARNSASPQKPLRSSTIRIEPLRFFRVTMGPSVTATFLKSPGPTRVPRPPTGLKAYTEGVLDSSSEGDPIHILEPVSTLESQEVLIDFEFEIYFPRVMDIEGNPWTRMWWLWPFKSPCHHPPHLDGGIRVRGSDEKKIEKGEWTCPKWFCYICMTTLYVLQWASIQVMAWWLWASGHYLNCCWKRINEVKHTLFNLSFREGIHFFINNNRNNSKIVTHLASLSPTVLHISVRMICVLSSDGRRLLYDNFLFSAKKQFMSMCIHLSTIYLVFFTNNNGFCDKHVISICLHISTVYSVFGMG